MMPGAGRQFAQTHGAQLPAHRLLGDREPERLPSPLDQIGDAPANDAMDRRVRSALDDLEQGRALPCVEKRWLARRLASRKALRAMSIEPHDPIAHLWQTNATDRASARSRLPGANHRKRRQAANLARIVGQP